MSDIITILVDLTIIMNILMALACGGYLISRILHKTIKLWQNVVPRKTLDITTYKPSDTDISNACLSFRHDYGLLSEGLQKVTRVNATFWLEAWQKTIANRKEV